MGYHGKLKNGFACADPTPYSAMSAENARPGEIWTKRWSSDDEYLIVKNHGGFCTALKLTDEAVAAGIAVISKRKRYTDPAMVGYVFNSGLGEFVKTLPAEQFEDVIRALEDALQIRLLKEVGQEANESLPDPDADVYKEENAALKCEVAELKCAVAAERRRVEEADERAKAENRKADEFRIRFNMLKQMYEELLLKYKE